MKNIVKNYLNIIDFLKLAKLSDAQYKKIYDKREEFLPFLENSILSKKEKQEIGLDFDTAQDAFLFSNPNQTINELIEEKEEALLRLNNRNPDKLSSYLSADNITLLERPIPSGVIEKVQEITDRLKEHNPQEIDERIETQGSKLYTFLNNSDSMLDIIKYLYAGKVSENIIFRIIRDFSSFEKAKHIALESDNPIEVDFEEKSLITLSGDIAKAFFIYDALVQKMPQTTRSYLDKLNKKIKIKESDLFDILKATDMWSKYGLDDAEERADINEDAEEDVEEEIIEESGPRKTMQENVSLVPEDIPTVVTAPAVPIAKKQPEELTRSDIVANFKHVLKIIKQS